MTTMYKDEKLCDPDAKKYSPWRIDNEPYDPSAGMVLHNTMRFDVHLPYAGAFMSKEDWRELADEISQVISDILPKSYMDPHRRIHKETKMAHRETIVVSYD